MNIALPPEMEKKITRLAQEAGTSVGGYLSSVVSRLPEPKLGDDPQETIAAKLRQWQTDDGSALLPNASAKELFARWKGEDAQSSDEERRKEYALWTEIEKSLQNQQGLTL